MMHALHASSLVHSYDLYILGGSCFVADKDRELQIESFLVHGNSRITTSTGNASCLAYRKPGITTSADKASKSSMQKLL